MIARTEETTARTAEKAALRGPIIKRFQTSSLHKSTDTVSKQEKWKVSPR